MMRKNDSRYYPGIFGGKTDYTSLAGNTLVTFAERDGMTLVGEGASQNMVTFDCLNSWTQCGQVRMIRQGD